MAVVGGAIKGMYTQKPKDALDIFKYIVKKVTITNDKEFNRAKELRKFWKGIDSSSYKKDGLILKNKCQDFLLKNKKRHVDLCLSFFNDGKMETLFKCLNGIYEVEPNTARYVLKHIAQNTRCDDNSRVGVTKEYMVFWSNLDSSHYNKYQAKLKQAYVADVSKLSKSSVQKFLIACTEAITKPQYAAGEKRVLDNISSIKFHLDSMHSYSYYNYTYLNKNDFLVVFLSSFYSCIYCAHGSDFNKFIGSFPPK